MPSPGHLGQIKNSLLSTHHQLPERGLVVSTPHELPEIKSRTNDGPEFGRDLSRVTEKFSFNLTTTLRDCRSTTAAPTPHPRNSEARQDDRDGRIPNVTRDVVCGSTQLSIMNSADMGTSRLSRLLISCPIAYGTSSTRPIFTLTTTSICHLST